MNEFPISISSLNEETGELTGVAAFDDGDFDRNRNRYKAGAFDKSLAEHRQRGTMPAMLLHHDHNRPVGTWLDIATCGASLQVKGRIERAVRDGAEAYALVKNRAIRSLSTGCIPIAMESSRPRATREPGELSGTIVTEADLIEISLVSIPANRRTNITSVSSINNIRDLEGLLASAGLSNRRAKLAASAAWRAINANPDPSEEILKSILAVATADLAMFNRSAK